ncbi:hypothetical protein [Nocardioides aequoreus]|uniref:hypothetical protein n=1 Tax=Nocardioides aequoreus TaxID=397278 RepID=UPI0006906776|nr:hypothetical protein [Nocardioides aequoreus]
MPRGLLVALLLALGLLTGTACQGGVEVEPPRPSASSDAAGDATQVRRLVDDLGAALRDRDAQAAQALGTGAGSALLRAVVANAEALQVDRLRLRYLTDDGPPSDAERGEHGDDVRAARLSLRFGYAGADRRATTVESRVLLEPTDDGPRVVGFGGPGGSAGTRTPLWLQAPLDVVRDGRLLLAVAGEGAGRYPALARRALQQVRAVLPAWDGALVVEVPADQAQLDAALAAPAGEYDAIAGLATAVSGADGRGAPVRVMVNPAVFDGLSQRGAQVVLTHEATHVAVDAPFADVPVWLLEGFADYVALADGSVPVDVAARQVLQRVREDGPPDGLPTAADLRPTAADLAATYEEAWLACRFLAQEHGEAGLVRLYEAVDDGVPVARAFEEELGTSQADFVARWRDDVRRLAGVAG